MRTTLRSSVAAIAAVLVLAISAISAAASNPEPIPTPVAEDGGGAAGACLEGAEDCNDIPGGVPVDGSGGGTEPGSGGGMAMCAEGHPDCNDVIVGDGEGPSCGEVVEGEGPDATVSYTPCDEPAPPVPAEPVITEPAPGTTTDPRPRTFDSASIGDDDLTVTIDFVSGVEPCYVLDHVDVDESSDRVTITLFEGSDVSAGQVACIEIGVFKRTIVTLDQPLAGREIVDGAA
jgi:hypothetical protein